MRLAPLTQREAEGMFCLSLDELRLRENETRRGRLRFFGARNHLRRERRKYGGNAIERQSDLQTGHHKLGDVDRSFVRSVAAGDFAIGHVAHVMAAVHRHCVFGGCALVVMAGNGAMIAHTAGHAARKPGGASKRSLQQQDSEQTQECR